MNKDRLQTLARDLRKTPPRSPRETLGGFVIAARMLDKARADLLGINGEYNFYPCGLGAYFGNLPGSTRRNSKSSSLQARQMRRSMAGFEKTRRRRIKERSSSGTMRCVACASAISLRKFRNISNLYPA